MSNKRQGPTRRPTGPGRNCPGTVDWYGPLFTPTGYGDEARGFVKGLQRLGFPLRVAPIDTVVAFAQHIADEDPAFFTETVNSMTRTARDPITAVVHFAATANFAPMEHARTTVVRTMWETNLLHPSAVAALNSIDEIWVPSVFNEEGFRSSGVTVPIHVIGGGVDIQKFRPGIAPLRLDHRRSTVFLSIFEWSFRKGWDVLLRAWASAFSADDDVTLVLRTYPRNKFANTDSLQRESEAMVDDGLAQLGLRRDALAPILVVGQHLEASQLPRLMAAADCYVGPSRGEGWGRPLQEAMACGLPVIGTRWSGNLEFMDETNSLLVDVEGLVPIDDRMDVPHYRGQMWAEPSVDHLSELLRRVAGDPQLRQRVGAKARSDMESSWQWRHLAEKAGERLLELGEANVAHDRGAEHVSTGLEAPPAAAPAALDPNAVLAATAQGSRETAATTRAGTTTFLLALADELLADDALLRSFGASFTNADDVTLLVYGPGLDPERFAAELTTTATRCGADIDSGPKILVIVPPTTSEAQDRDVASRAAAVLSATAPGPHHLGLAVLAPGEPIELRRRLSQLASAATARPDRSAPPNDEEQTREHQQAPKTSGRASTPLKKARNTGDRVVSVLVPTFNRAEYLDDCMASVLAQTYGDLEIILVDNCSTDGTQDLAAEYASKDRRVTLFHNDENLGLVGNHRRCLALATGRFVKFVHADDRLRPHAVERLVEAISASPAVSIASAAREVIDERGVTHPPIPSTQRMVDRDTRFDGIQLGDALFRYGLNLIGEPTSVLYPRALLAPGQFSALAGRDYTSLLDISSWLALLARGQLAFVAEPLSDVRIHAGQEGQTIGLLRANLEWLQLMEDARPLGFLADPAVELEAVRMFTTRLFESALERTAQDSPAVGPAIDRSIARIAALTASIERATSPELRDLSVA